MARKGTESIAKWQARVRLSLEERNRKQPDWDLIYKYFRGTQWEGYESEAGDLVIVNQVYSHVKAVVPATYTRNPYLYTKATRVDTTEKARLTETVLNQKMYEMKLKDMNKRITQDVVLYGTGFSKTVYEVENLQQEQADQAVLDSLRQRFRNVSAQAITGGELGAIRANCASYRVDPRNLVFAVGSTDIGDPGFIGHRTVKRVGAIKRDPRYKNTKGLKPSLSLDINLRGAFSDIWDLSNDEDFGLVELWEIWDIENTGTVGVFAEGHDRWLVEPDTHDYPVDHVFDKVVFTPLDDQQWGESEITPWINNQDELNKLRTMQMRHIKRFNRKYVVLQNSVEDEDELKKLEKGVDGAVIRVRGVQSAANAVASIQDAPMPADLYRMGSIIEDDIIKIGRISTYRRGSTQGADTATEANIVEANAQLGDVDRIDAMNGFVLSQMDKVRKYLKAFTPGVQIAQRTGRPDDVERWEAWRREDIDIEAEMHVEFGSSVPTSDQQKKADAVQLYDRAMANPTVHPQAAFSRLLEAWGERDQAGWFLPPTLIQIQLMMKAMEGGAGAKGISPTASVGTEPGPEQPLETPAELRGRAAPTSGGAK